MKKEDLYQLKTHPSWCLRPFTLADAPAVVEIMRASSLANLGYADVDLEEMLSDWTAPGVDLLETARVLVDEQGQIIGYCDIWDSEAPHVTKWCWVDIHPDRWEDAVALELLGWSEQAARARMHLAPDGARVILGYGLNHRQERSRCMLEAASFELVRHYYRMQIELDQQPAQPALNGFAVRPMRYPDEFPMAVNAIQEGFRDHWGYIEHDEQENLAHWQHYVDNSLFFDPSLWFFAFTGEQLAGLCFCKAGISEDPELGWVNQLAVLRSYRRRGLGKALLQHAFFELYQRGRRKVALGVDATSLTNATHLYESAGMRVVRQYDTYHKELRPGKDLSTQELDNTE